LEVSRKTSQSFGSHLRPNDPLLGGSWTGEGQGVCIKQKLLEEKKMTGTSTIWEKSINEYGEAPDPEGSVFFRVSVKETVVRTYLTTDPDLKTAKAVREQHDEWGTDDWREMDSADWDGSRISKIEKVVYSPCSFALRYLTPPADYPADALRYISSSTMFDEQPEGSSHLFSKNAIRRKYERCTSYVEGKTSSVCVHCFRRLNEGWSFIKPLKEASE
jgi:hypothetical protein